MSKCFIWHKQWCKWLINLFLWTEYLPCGPLWNMSSRHIGKHVNLSSQLFRHESFPYGPHLSVTLSHILSRNFPTGYWLDRNIVQQESRVNEWVTSRIASYLNTLRPRQNGRHFPDDTSKCIILNENIWTLIKISLKFVPKGLINNIPSLVLKIAWHWPGDKPLSEPMIVRLPMHIFNTRPQWVNSLNVMPAKMVWLIILKTKHLYVFKIWSCRKSSCLNW